MRWYLFGLEQYAALFDGFILYEAAGVMGIDENGRMHTSDELEEAIKASW